jgi:hypothetical protein
MSISFQLVKLYIYDLLIVSFMFFFLLYNQEITGIADLTVSHFLLIITVKI